MLRKEQLAGGREVEYIQKILNEEYKEITPPVEHLMNVTKKTPSKYWAFYDNEKIIGGLFEFWDPCFTYISYLCVHSQHKEKKYENEIMDIIQRENKDVPIVVCVYVPDDKTTTFEKDKKRYDFYIKNGFKDTEITIINPYHNLKLLMGGNLLNPNYIIKSVIKIWKKSSWTINNTKHNWLWFLRNVKIKRG